MAFCPCGKTPLSAIDEGSDTCGRRCEKKLSCSLSRDHICRSQCHTGDCPPCDKVHVVWCIKCNSREIIDGQEENYVCSNCDKCNVLLNCGSHYCRKVNCPGSELHQCDQVCNKILSCGKHVCCQPCHSGSCRVCDYTGNDKLSCYCGAQVIYPPVPCGTELPKCNKLCTKEKACSHKGVGNYLEYVRKELQSLIKTAKEMNRTEIYRFPTTSSYNRWITHEVAEELGCESKSYDIEPHRYTVVTFRV